MPAAVRIEYIASAKSGHGFGGALVAEIRRRHPSGSVTAQTDDAAIGFYRPLGFAASTAPADSRWPDPARYECRLPGA